MKKFISVLLTVAILISSFSIMSFAKKETKSYIDRQSSPYVKDIAWGTMGNTKDNGCGWISVYNILTSQSNNITTDLVISEMTDYNAPFFFGLLGANPFAMKRYLATKFQDVSMSFFDRTLWALKSNNKDGVIILYQGKDLFSPLHYVAGIPTGGKDINDTSYFNFYNTGKVSCYSEYTVDEYLNILKDSGCKLIMFITVDGKIGQW